MSVGADLKAQHAGDVVSVAEWARQLHAIGVRVLVFSFVHLQAFVL